MTKVLLIAAMREEVDPLLNILNKRSKWDDVSCKKLNRDTYSSYYISKGTQSFILDISITGVGMIPSIISLSNLKLGVYRDYSLILNIGSVGATRDFKVGEIVSPKVVYNGDFDLSIFGYDKYEIPSIGKYITTTHDRNRPNPICISSSKFTTDTSEYNTLGNSYILDMELYGLVIAITSFYNNSKNCTFCSYKIVTDNGSKSEHENNLTDLSCKLCEYVVNVLFAYTSKTNSKLFYTTT